MFNYIVRTRQRRKTKMLSMTETILSNNNSLKTFFKKGIFANYPEMEFKEFKPRFKSAKTRFKLSAGFNLETFDTIFKWNQPYLNHGLNLNRRSNSLNSATVYIN